MAFGAAALVVLLLECLGIMEMRVFDFFFLPFEKKMLSLQIEFGVFSRLYLC